MCIIIKYQKGFAFLHNDFTRASQGTDQMGMSNGVWSILLAGLTLSLTVRVGYALGSTEAGRACFALVDEGIVDAWSGSRNEVMARMKWLQD